VFGDEAQCITGIEHCEDDLNAGGR
jgi:hypothetical protein